MSVLNYRSGGTFVTRQVNNTVFSQLIDQPSGLMFITYHGNTYVIQSINRFDGQAFLGGIGLRLNEQMMASFNEILGSDQGTHYIYGSNQTLIGGTKNDDINAFISLNTDQIKPRSIFYESYEDDLLWATSTSRNELTIVKTIPVSAFDQALRPIQYITIAIAAIALGISVLLSYLISNKISEPISRIVTRMQQAPLDEIRITSDHYDEITQLERGYNEMTEAIKKLIIEKYKKNLELKTAQLKALQSQMNPHFLNNTFQLIGGMALAIKADNIYGVTSSMGEMMKYALTKDDDLLTLDEEVRHTINYLDIQKQRFTDKVDTKIHFNKNLSNYLIPKFTLQPLVENSFKHGFTSKDKAWKIDVDIKADQQNIIITIKDNGIGMTSEKAEEINKLLSESSTHLIQAQISDSTGIGLSNIHQRIQLLFGVNYGLKVEALETGGTAIVVCIPKKDKGIETYV
jgi:two-component system, sensor histidine kinase YesM